MIRENPCGPYDGMPWPSLTPPAGWDVEWIDSERGWRSKAWLWVPEEIDFTGLWTMASAPITYYRSLPEAGLDARRMAAMLERDRNIALERGLDVDGLRRWKEWMHEQRLAFRIGGGRNTLGLMTGLTS